MSDESIDSTPDEVLVVRWYYPAWLRNLVSLVRQQPILSALLAIAVVGLGISIYLTTSHYEKVPPVCTVSGVINCANVLKSQFSTIPGTGKNGIPITIPGMLWFIVSGALALVALVRIQRGQPELERLRLYHLLWAIVGMLFVLYLVYAEIVQLHQICEWCTGVHILTVMTFVLVWYRFANPDAGRVQAAPAYEYIPPVRKHAASIRTQRATLPRSMRSKSRQTHARQPERLGGQTRGSGAGK